MSGSQQLTLSQILAQVDALLSQLRFDDAAQLLAQVQQQARGQDLVQVSQRLVQLELARGRTDAARQAMARLLRRHVVSAGKPPAAGEKTVLILYGLGSAAHLQFHPRDPSGMQFTINHGHFDTVALLRQPKFGYLRCFLAPDATAEEESLLRQVFQKHACVINSIADPSMEEACLRRASTLLAATGTPVVNTPAAVLKTWRHNVASRLAGVAGLVVPRAERVPAQVELLQARLNAAPQGLILRPLESQTGIGMVVVRTEAELRQALQGYAKQQELFAIDYHDFRSRDGYFRKMRMFRIGARLLPEHRIAFDAWNVHSADRHRLMRDNAGLREEEQAFLHDPRRCLGVEAVRTLEESTSRLELDYVGIDFAQLADGRLLLFESNPAMRVNYDHVTHFPYLQPHLENLSTAFTQMVAAKLRD